MYIWIKIHYIYNLSKLYLIMFCQSRPISQNVQDSPTFSSMNVHWSLRGFTIHTTVLALCLCGILHRDLDLADRCENCITGFLLLDIFKILARELCEARRLPTGSLFAAPQTCTILQACALSGEPCFYFSLYHCLLLLIVEFRLPFDHV